MAEQLEPLASQLQATLGLGQPFNDPGVGVFGLRNAVFALGDCFLEIVSPEQPDTAAGRYMARQGGGGGYMAIFDTDDLAGARARAAQLRVRAVWEIDLPDIATTHLHPGDMRGAIVSLDQPDPPGSWRWGGPDWTGRIGRGAPGRLVGVTLAVDDPGAVAARWGEVLGVAAADDQARDGRANDRREEDGAAVLGTDGGEVRFVPARGGVERLIEIAVSGTPLSRGEQEAIELGGVTIRRVDGRPATG
ncbi:MAG: VOC family protein [Solirubrobacterales bacterium]|nr:VOC family protein [Solirubrobacterales bacterium]